MILACDARFDRRPPVIPILRFGLLATDICRRVGYAEVAAVFDRSFYLRAEDYFLCVGDSTIGNGPLTLIADVGVSVPLSGLGLRPGQRADISTRCISIGNAIQFSLEDCERWRPPEWPTRRRTLASWTPAPLSRAAPHRSQFGLGHAGRQCNNVADCC